MKDYRHMKPHSNSLHSLVKHRHGQLHLKDKRAAGQVYVFLDQVVSSHECQLSLVTF